MKNSYITKSTIRNVYECSPDFLQASGAGSRNSSAVELMQWLRNQASETKQLYYKVLSYEGNSAANIFKNPKGRPSRALPNPNSETVALDMTYALHNNRLGRKKR